MWSGSPPARGSYNHASGGRRAAQVWSQGLSRRVGDRDQMSVVRYIEDRT